jgi:aldose 1-epimerase
VTAHPFGALPDGRAVELYSIRSEAVELNAITFGGIITSLRVPDRQGRLGDVVLGHGALEGYLHNPSYLGAIVGRYANRIAAGRFQLDGIAHQLATNDGANHLHGGTQGFDQQLWTAASFTMGDAAGVTFARTSPAGEEHYPGALRVEVSYLVTSIGAVVLQYHATTDLPTIVNLTQHTYFNLAGETSTSVLDHELTISADRYTPIAAGLIPTGEIASVEGTPFDFRTRATLGSRVQLADEQLRAAGGFDHNFVLARAGDGVAAAATLRDPHTGRVLTIETTEPGLQFYGGHLLDGRTTGAYGRVFDRYAGLCLETQHFPDSPNQPQFPSVTLRPGETYQSTTIWRFAAD